MRGGIDVPAAEIGGGKEGELGPDKRDISWSLKMLAAPIVCEKFAVARSGVNDVDRIWCVAANVECPTCVVCNAVGNGAGLRQDECACARRAVRLDRDSTNG